MFKIALGSKVKDKVTGLVGIVTGRTEYMNGCKAYIIKPPMDKNKKVHDAEYVDEDQLVVMGKGLSTTPARSAPKRRSPGGPQSDRSPESYRG